MNGYTCRLEPFAPGAASVVAGWASGPRELEDWASILETPLASDFAAWHADPDVHAFVLQEADAPIGYGECWVDTALREIEFGRLIVEPARRGRGIGALLLQRLIERAREFAVDTAWVRVAPRNGAALACYSRAGFERVPPEEQREFNAPQPRDYVWMRRAL